MLKMKKENYVPDFIIVFFLGFIAALLAGILFFKLFLSPAPEADFEALSNKQFVEATVELDLIGVIDGDTLAANIIFPLDILLTNQRIRVLGYDAWEVTRRKGADDEEVKKGINARNAVIRLLQDSKITGSNIIGKDSFGRVLCDVYVEKNGSKISLKEYMIAEGHSKIGKDE